MIFNEDSILLSFFDVYEDEEELKDAILKYSQNNSLENMRPEAVDTTKSADIGDLDQVIALFPYWCNNTGHQPNW